MTPTRLIPLKPSGLPINVTSWGSLLWLTCSLLSLHPMLPGYPAFLPHCTWCNCNDMSFVYLLNFKIHDGKDLIWLRGKGSNRCLLVETNEWMNGERLSALCKYLASKAVLSWEKVMRKEGDTECHQSSPELCTSGCLHRCFRQYGTSWYLF